VDQPPTPDAPSTRAEVPGWRASVRPLIPTAEGALAGYTLLEEIARGGMGVVYRAHDVGLNRDVAVKVVKDEYRSAEVAVRRFIEEGQITGQLQHPAIPAVHQIGTLPDSSPFLAMKLIKGETLAARLARADCDRSGLVPIFQRVAEAVGYAHSRGVIHRDLKPANVMVGAFGEVQVMDWGLAKVLRKGECTRAEAAAGLELATVIDAGRSANPDSETQAGSVMGTPAYMPPEQAGGELDKVDERSDVFGLGAVLCQMLTGEPPYNGPTADAVRLMAVRGQLADAFARIDGCGADPELVALCKRCLDPDRDRRPADGGAVATAVANLLAAAEERARQAELDRVRAEGERAKAQLQAAEQRKRKRIVLCLGVSLAALVGLAGGGALYVQKERADRDRAEAERAHEEEEALREQAVIEERTRVGVEGILHQLPDLYRRAKWDQATGLLDEADALIGPDGDGSWRVRVARARMDTTVLRRLDRIQLDRAVAIGGPATRQRVRRDYPLAFRESGFDVTGDESAAAAAAARLKVSPDRECYLRALADWACADAGPTRERICAAADAVAGDEWRTRLLAAAASGANLAEWLAQVPEAERRPGLTALAVVLARETGGDALAILEEGVRRHPTDFWLHLAFGEVGEAVRLEPQLALARSNLGAVLAERGDRAGAARELREAIRLNPGQAAAHRGLGQLLAEAGDRAGAAREFREAVRLDPGDAAAHDSLGTALDGDGDLKGAVRELREAVRLAPRHHVAHYNLGSALMRAGDLAGAMTAFRDAARMQPRNRAYQQALSRVERWQALLPRLPDIVAGRSKPADPTEALAFADLCAQPFQRRYVLAVRLEADAFAADPKLAADREAGYRYEAANHAAQAMAGLAVDLPTFDVSEWAYLSGTAHRWLRADLAALAGVSQRVTADALTQWKADPDLVSIRDPEWLAAMPAADRARWQQFWADVEALLARSQRP
jgi:Flp pilus assembly protein TadD/tRNA A-37 threonylcarbamoyl transferase component Bud32